MTPTREESIILGLWIEFAHETKPEDSFYCMGDLWHGHRGALQAAEKFLKEKGLINHRGVPYYLCDEEEE